MFAFNTAMEGLWCYNYWGFGLSKCTTTLSFFSKKKNYYPLLFLFTFAFFTNANYRLYTSRDLLSL
jgi:hypothetical protein